MGLLSWYVVGYIPSSKLPLININPETTKTLRKGRFFIKMTIQDNLLNGSNVTTV